MFEVTLEKPGHGPHIENLLDQSFEPTRRQRTAYCLRADNPPLAELCFVIQEQGLICASIRYWRVVIDGRHPALLLGPLAVRKTWRGNGFGKTLVSHSLARATDLGHEAVLVIGDADYYQPFGFSNDLAVNLTLPKPATSGCFQARELVPGGLMGLSGEITATND